MRALPPAFDEAALAEHLRASYRIDPTSLRFVPKGDVGWSWVVDSAAGTWFVKLYDATREDHLQKVARSVAVLNALHDSAALANVPRPIAATTGAFDTRLDRSWQVAVQTFIPGEPFGSRPLTHDAAAKIGEAAARLHEGTDVVAGAACLEPEADGGANGLVEFLDSRRREVIAHAPQAAAHIDDVIERVRLLDDRVADRPTAPLVVVHGDMAHDNVLMDDDGNLGIVDWDDARLATAEAELAMTAWLSPDVFPTLVRAYLDHRPTALDVEAMELKAWRYNIGSIWFYLERLEDDALPQEQAVSDRNLLRWVVDEWQTTSSRFDAAANAIARAAAV